MFLSSSRSQLWQRVSSFSNFCTIGFFTAALYFAVFSVLWKMFFIDYKIAVSIGYFSGVSFQFFMNRQITFKSNNKNIYLQCFKFSILLGINYLITLMIVNWTVENLLLSPYIGIILSVAITVLVGFLLSKFWVYK